MQWTQVRPREVVDVTTGTGPVPPPKAQDWERATTSREASAAGNDMAQSMDMSG